MGCSPEVARQNAKKSTGPRSARGKAIVAQNGKKHGLLSTKPPILATEDLETFQDIMAGLIDEYQPDTPTEHLLVQQVGMGWLRLHRLWSTEAARANREILRAMRDRKYPDYPAKDLHDYLSPSRPTSYKEVLISEKRAIVLLIEELTADLSQYGKLSKAQWLAAVGESLTNLYSRKPEQIEFWNAAEGFWKDCSNLFNLLAPEDEEGNPCKPPSVEVLKTQVEALIESAKTKLTEIDTTLGDIAKHDQMLQEANYAGMGLNNPELFARYERHITHQLNVALDRLVHLKKQRSEEDCITLVSTTVPETVAQFR